MLHAHYVEPIPEWELQGSFRKARFRRPRLVLTAKDLDQAVRGCDKYAISKVLHGNLALGYASRHNSSTKMITN